MVRFKCHKCQYEFEPKNKLKLTPPNICPYCGKEGTLAEKKHILQEI